MADPVVPPPSKCEHGKTYGHSLWNGPFGSPLSQIVDSCPGPVVPPEQHDEMHCAEVTCSALATRTVPFGGETYRLCDRHGPVAESDLVARTRQLFENIERRCRVGAFAGGVTDLLTEIHGYAREGLAVVPALLADNESQRQQIIDLSEDCDDLTERLMRALAGEVSARVRADAAEARLTQAEAWIASAQMQRKQMDGYTLRMPCDRKMCSLHADRSNGQPVCHPCADFDGHPHPLYVADTPYVAASVVSETGEKP